MVTTEAVRQKGDTDAGLARTEFKPIQVTIKMGSHGNCKKTDHADCDLDTALGGRLRANWTDMVISPVIVYEGNTVSFKMGFKGRETTKKEADWRISDFFSHNPILTMESLKTKRAKE